MHTITLLAPLALTYAGFVALALSMDRHRRQLLPDSKAWTTPMFWTLRVSGWALLIAAMAGCIALQGTGIGLTLWTAYLTVAATSLAMLITYAPRLALGLTGICVPMGLVLLVA